MDLVLLQIAGAFGLKPNHCFNPYFNGSSTSTAIKKKKLKMMNGVSILILMDLVLLQR